MRSPDARRHDSDATAAPPDALGRLIELYQENAGMLAELTRVRRRLATSLAYALEVGHNPALAAALLSRQRAKQTALLTLLRANRLRARALIAHADWLPEAA